MTPGEEIVFSELVAEMADGSADAEISAACRRLMRLAAERGGKGKLTVTIEFEGKPTDDQTLVFAVLKKCAITEPPPHRPLQVYLYNAEDQSIRQARIRSTGDDDSPAYH